MIVGVEGYYDKYAQLGAEVARAARVMSGAGMELVHAAHRRAGSTVLALGGARTLK